MKNGFKLTIRYSWGDVENDQFFDSFEKAWNKAKSMAAHEAEVSSLEHGCDIGLEFIKPDDKEEGQIVLHYSYDNTYCFYIIQKTRDENEDAPHGFDPKKARQIDITKQDIRCTDDFEMDFEEEYVEAIYELYLDVDAYFGTDTCGKEDTWINFYTRWYAQTGEIKGIVTIDSPTDPVTIDWPLTKTEQEFFFQKMNDWAKRMENVSMPLLYKLDKMDFELTEHILIYPIDRSIADKLAILVITSISTEDWEPVYKKTFVYALNNGSSLEIRSCISDGFYLRVYINNAVNVRKEYTVEEITKNNLSDAILAAVQGQVENLIQPLTIDEIKQNMDNKRFISGVVSVELSDINSDPDDFYDILSMKLTGTDLLMAPSYQIVSVIPENNTLLVRVSGDASCIIED